MNYDVFLQGFRLQLSRFQSGKILHFPYGSNSQSHKNMFSRSFRDGKTQHTSNSLNYSLRREDRGEFCAFWQPYLLPWLGETVLSTNKGQVAVSFRKLKCLTKVTIVMKRSEPLCFSHRFKSPTIQLSHGNKKKNILPSGPNLRIHNNMHTCFSELCKDTCRTQWTIPWERRSGEIVLWMLNLIPVVILFRWN